MDNVSKRKITMGVGMKPFLRWAGSKRKLLGRLLPYWRPKFERYVEPFMGSSCLFFRISPARAILGDINRELVDTYKQVKMNPQQVAKHLSKLRRTKAVYDRLRKTAPSDLSPPEAAARFLFLNRYCFNGLYRTNLRGQFNVPYAPADTGSLPTAEQLQKYSLALKNVTLRTGDFETTLADVSKGDFVYLDPPYIVGARRVFREYNARVFSTADLDRLAECLQEIDRKGARFVLTYAYCMEARHAFRMWPQTKIFTQRNISGFVRGRRKAAELLLSNCPSSS